jgi:hypothetical protein
MEEILKIQKGKTCYSEEQVISMLEFLIDSIFVSFGGILFQQVVGIPMGTNCAPLLADLLLYSSSNSRYKSINSADEAVSVVSITSSSVGYINGRNSANLELLIDTSSIYLYVKLKAKEIIHKAFIHRNNGSKCVWLGYNSTYFSNKIQKGKTCYSEEQVISMLEFLIDSIFV